MHKSILPTSRCEFPESLLPEVTRPGSFDCVAPLRDGHYAQDDSLSCQTESYFFASAASSFR